MIDWRQTINGLDLLWAILGFGVGYAFRWWSSFGERDLADAHRRGDLTLHPGDRMFSPPPPQRVRIAVLDDQTCSSCMALHGTRTAMPGFIDPPAGCDHERDQYETERGCRCRVLTIIPDRPFSPGLYRPGREMRETSPPKGSEFDVSEMD